MDILIPDSLLREYLKTSAKPQKIAECISLCGPSVERIEKFLSDYVYHIEVTTNRVDSASVYGIAREAAAILPQFKIQATLKQLKPLIKVKTPIKPLPLKIKCDISEIRRVMAVVIDNVQANQSPDWIKQRLEMSGFRSLNLLIDITNYVMLETGHPTHVFDYDRIKSHELIFRKSDKGEKIKSLENKTYTLPGGDIVIDDSDGEIIDLPGIIGTANSVVTPNTKRIIFFIDNNDPVHMRRTSMSLGIRTAAVTINEKDVDPELASLAFARGIQLYKELAKGKISSKIIDIYPNQYKEKYVKTNLEFINHRLGVDIKKEEVNKILESLGFKTKWINDALEVSVPSWRSHDIEIPEDIVEEVARIYGYHNLPSQLMTGVIPEPLENAPFSFESSIKQILKGLGGVEIYTLSLVAKDKVSLEGQSKALKLKNPLGKYSEYLRLSLEPSLVDAAKQNKSVKESFHLFEMSNVYIPTHENLPNEAMKLAGIFSGYEFREAKGIVENLLSQLNITANFIQENEAGFITNRRAKIKSNSKNIGILAVLESNLIYYEFDVESLRSIIQPKSFTPLPKYPPQVEDLSVILTAQSVIGEVIDAIEKVHQKIAEVELIDIFDDTKTFRITYQDPNKTLTDNEVAKIRAKIIKMLQTKFSARIK